MRIRSVCSLALALPILGCSNHPLPDRVTGYSSAELVEKLRCEAQKAVLFHVFNNDWREAQHNYLRARHTLKNIDKFNADNKINFGKYNKITEKHDGIINPIKARLSEINDEIEIAIATMKTINDYALKGKWFKGLRDHYEKEFKEKGSIKDASNSVGIITVIGKNENIISSKELINLNKLINKFNSGKIKDEEYNKKFDNILESIIEKVASKKGMAKGIVSEERLDGYREIYKNKDRKLSALSLKAESIDRFIKQLEVKKETELNNIDPGGTGQTKKIIKATVEKTNQTKEGISRTSEKEIVRELFLFNNIKLTLKLDFDITEINNASAGLKLLWPKLRQLGNISLNMSASKDKTRKAQRVITTVSTFEELSDQHKLNCWDTVYAHHSNRARTYPIKGNVGIGELIDQYLEISESTSVPNEDESFIDTLTFTTALKAGFNPTIELKKITPQVLEGGLDFNAERTDIHTVTVFLESHVPSSVKPVEKLDIVGFPELRISKEEILDDDEMASNTN